MLKDRMASHSHRRALWLLREQARINGGNDMIVRLCMIGLGIAIVSIAPVTWVWKIVLFLVIMFIVSIIVPVIWRVRRNPN